ncbi:uncharacterized protein BDV17DRAFT_88949 [Aspergillus undulatus]|uniref:uncharacterized protein n=1 Tax=Aspergillus undulatus TaxID=1810928 RepID=UPI003CCE2FBC
MTLFSSAMLRAAPAYLVGGVSLLLAVIVTVIDGMCYGSSVVSSPDNSLVEALIVSFSIITCPVVLALILISANEPKIDTWASRKRWRTTTYGAGIGYLALATGVTAGGIAWSTSVPEAKESSLYPHRRSLLVARCVLWAFSVLAQGMLCGVLLTSWRTVGRANLSQWPSLASYELDGICPSRSVALQKAIYNSPSSATKLQRQSTDTLPKHQPSVSSTTSRCSARYSGKTLTPSDSKLPSNGLNPAPISYPETATTRTRPEDHASEGNQSRLQQLHRSSLQIEQSLDSVMLRPSSITPSSTQPEAKYSQAKPKLPDESNVHPLFRSSTRSPPPTPSPSTIVLASPDAGQTITVKTLQRMRSTCSVGTRTPRNRSVLLEQTDHLFEGVELRRASNLSCKHNGHDA